MSKSRIKSKYMWSEDQVIVTKPKTPVKKADLTGLIGALEILRGGAGSGNWGHAGRQGKIGGSGRGTGSALHRPTTRKGVMGTAVTYVDHAQLAKDVFNSLPPETQNRIRETEKRIRSGTPTIDIHTDANGNFTPERVKLHDKIVTGMLKDTTPVDNPEIVLTGGLPGSGKSTVLKERGEKFDNHVQIDSDAIKAQLPEYEGWNAALVHEEASHVVKRAIEQSVIGDRNVMYDATMKSTASTKKIVGAFEDAGYKSKVIFVDIPMDTAMDRAVSRFMGPTNRYVPLDYIASHDTKNVQTLNSVKGSVGSWEHWDNSQPRGQPPTLIDKG